MQEEPCLAEFAPVRGSLYVDYMMLMGYGIILVRVDGYYYLLDESGERIIEMRFDDVYNISEGFIPVMKNGRWGFVNRMGEIVIDFAFFEVDIFEYGIAVVAVANTDISRPLRCDFPDEYTFFDYFDNFLEMAFYYGYISMGLIDVYGEWVIPPVWEDIRNFRKGLASVSMGGLWGVINF